MSALEEQKKAFEVLAPQLRQGKTIVVPDDVYSLLSGDKWEEPETKEYESDSDFKSERRDKEKASNGKRFMWWLFSAVVGSAIGGAIWQGMVWGWFNVQ